MTEKPYFDPDAEAAEVRAAVMSAPAPGSDPDTLRRIQKVHTAAANSSGASDDTTRRAGKVDTAAGAEPEKKDDEKDVKVKRAAQPTKVQGRTATPPGKAKA